MDDIESLLSEFEADIENSTPNKCRILIHKDGEESSDDLSDLLNLTPPHQHHSSSTDVTNLSGNKLSIKKSPKLNPRKCNPVYISGSGYAFGYSSSLNPRSCDRLLCLDCDFNVSIFSNFKWKSDKTDYLFLRNNAPDFHRLKDELIMAKGWNAYCCQCQSRHTNSMNDINTQTDLKWICTKH